MPRVAQRFLFLDLDGQPLQPVPAVVCHSALQLIDLNALILAAAVQPFHLRVQTFPLVVQGDHALVEQGQLQAFEVDVQAFTAATEIIDLCHEARVPLAVGHQRREQFQLALRLEHRFMRAVEVIEVCDQRADTRRDVERFQHMTAHEVSEIAHRLHRHRLVEQLQRLIVVDAEAPTEPRPVFGKAVLDLSA